MEARLQHIAWTNAVMGRHDQMRQNELRSRNRHLAIRGGRFQCRDFARDAFRPQGVQQIELTATRGFRPPVGEIDDLSLLRTVDCRVRLLDMAPPCGDPIQSEWRRI